MSSVFICVSLLLGVFATLLSARCWRRLLVYRDEMLRASTDLKELQGECLQNRRMLIVEKARRLCPKSSQETASLSQHGEDAWIWEYLGCPLSGFYIEAGAYDGRIFSNSFFFESIGWTGLLVEANQELAKLCALHRPKSTVVHGALSNEKHGDSVRFSIAQGATGLDLLSFTTSDDSHRARIEREGGFLKEVEVPATTLNTLLEKLSPTTIEFMTLDIEGAELTALEGLDLTRWRPKLLLIESNSASASAKLSDFFASKQYSFIKRLGANDVFSDDLARINATSKS